jgi:hypothetical protein
MRRLRILVGVAILIVSAALLVWGLMPARREVRTQPVPPVELQLPTPISFHLQLFS